MSLYRTLVQEAVHCPLSNKQTNKQTSLKLQQPITRGVTSQVFAGCGSTITMFHRVNPDQSLTVILSFYLTECSQFRDVACFYLQLFILLRTCPPGERWTLRIHIKPACIHTHVILRQSNTGAHPSALSAVSCDFFFTAEGGEAVCCKHNGIIDLLTALSQAVSSTQAHCKKTPGSGVWGLHTMTAPWSSITSSYLFFWL